MITNEFQISSSRTTKGTSCSRQGEEGWGPGRGEAFSAPHSVGSESCGLQAPDTKKCRARLRVFLGDCSSVNFVVEHNFILISYLANTHQISFIYLIFSRVCLSEEAKAVTIFCLSRVREGKLKHGFKKKNKAMFGNQMFRGYCWTLPFPNN